MILSCRSGDDDVVEEWTLRPDWAYCCAGYRKTKQGIVEVERKVESAKELRPDFWYPTKTVYRNFDKAGNQVGKNVTEVLVVELLQEVPAGTFEPRFEPGVVVTDEIVGGNYVVGRDDGELERYIHRQASEFRARVDYGSFGGIVRSFGRPAALVLAAFGLGFWLLRRFRGQRTVRGRHGRRSEPTVPPQTAPLMLLTLAMLTPPVLAQTPFIAQEMPGVKFDCCALNAVAFVYAFYDLAAKPADLADRLGCDSARTRPVDLERMRQGLLASGELAVEAVRGVSLAQVAERVAECRGIAIVHAATGAAAGHCYVLATAGDQMIAADPGHGTFTGRPGEASMRRLENAFTGVALVITPRTTLPTWRLGDSASHPVELGAVGARIREERIAVVNAGQAPLSIAAARSSCGCFQEARLEPAQLAAGAAGTLLLRIDGSRLGEGATEQPVAIEFAIGQRPWPARLLLRALRSMDSRAAQPAVVPSLATAQPSEDGTSHAFLAVIHGAGGLVVDHRTIPGAEVTASVVDLVHGEATAIARRYRVDWRGTDTLVDFLVRDANGQDTVLRCNLRSVR